MGIEKPQIRREKARKFIELAEKRVNNCLKSVRLLTNLSNRSNYEYDPIQARKIVSAIEDEIKILKIKFRQGMKSSTKFKL